ncbi:Histone deacetylase 4 [Liparis tanakae]|uniref:Histone deacetylase 4 n=1 Tax=Liparis tanakae TaxID=230148 RepID=A0A4Z2GH72_9TELE|nr:Histone deacetylase 4 [Liparis tanakae]
MTHALSVSFPSATTNKLRTPPLASPSDSCVYVRLCCVVVGWCGVSSFGEPEKPVASGVQGALLPHSQQTSAVFLRTVVMPIANEFAPDVVLVSSGFDAVDGHAPPLGGYKLTAKPSQEHTRSARRIGMAPGPAKAISVCPSTGLSGGLEEVTGWVPRGAGNVKIGRRQGASVESALQDAPLALSAGGPLAGTHLRVLDPIPDEVLQQTPNANAVHSMETVLEIHSES